jgi:hypothetical protein
MVNFINLNIFVDAFYFGYLSMYFNIGNFKMIDFEDSYLIILGKLIAIPLQISFLNFLFEPIGKYLNYKHYLSFTIILFAYTFYSSTSVLNI